MFTSVCHSVNKKQSDDLQMMRPKTEVMSAVLTVFPIYCTYSAPHGEGFPLTNLLAG